MEQLAIIKDVGFGMRDCAEPVLWFTTYLDESTAALQVLGVDAAVQVIKDANAYDVHHLEGVPCFVQQDGGLVRFVRVAKIGRSA